MLMNISAIIKEHDKSLDALRQEWIDAPASRRGKLFKLIDRLLDQRLKLMQERDKKMEREEI